MNFSRLIDFKWVRQLNKVNQANFFSGTTISRSLIGRELWLINATRAVIGYCKANDLSVYARTVDVIGNLSVFFHLSNLARF